MLQDYTAWRVAQVFFNQPTKTHYLKEISRNINLAHTSVKQQLTFLHKENIITEIIIKKGTRSFPEYVANTTSKNYVHYKRLSNLQMLYASQVINYLQDKLMPKVIILFGSYQRGEDREDSDIDLFLECPQDAVDLKRFEDFLQRKIQLHFREDFGKFPKELKNNIINGVVLKGYLEVFR